MKKQIRIMLAFALPMFATWALISIFGAPSALAAPAATITVDTLSGGISDGSCVDGDCTIADAIDAATSGDTIDFSVSGQISLAGGLVITKDLVIDGGNVITVSGQDSFRVFDVQGANVTFHDITITEGAESLGAGLNVDSTSAVTLTGVTMTDNNASGFGGAIFNTSGTIVITGSMITANTAADSGGAVAMNGGSVSIYYSSVTSNDATAGSGGGILQVNGAQTMITYSDIMSNTAGGDGGFILNPTGNTLDVTYTTLAYNMAGANGGAINNGGTLTFAYNTAYGNGATSEGGALYNIGTANVNASTFTGNSAASGGAIFNESISLDLNSVTIVNNTATVGAGITGDGTTTRSVLNTSTTIENSIVANNNGGDIALIDGASPSEFVSEGYNLIGTISGSATFTETGDVTGITELGLGDFGDNGGATMNFEPQVGSPALNTGGGCGATDQNGNARPKFGVCDIGAVEGQMIGTYLPIVAKQ